MHELHNDIFYKYEKIIIPALKMLDIDASSWVRNFVFIDDTRLFEISFTLLSRDNELEELQASGYNFFPMLKNCKTRIETKKIPSRVGRLYSTSMVISASEDIRFIISFEEEES